MESMRLARMSPTILLGGGGVQAAEGRPIIHNQPRTHHVAASVHGSCHQGHLQQRAELVQVLDAGLGVHHAALVRQTAVAAHQHVAGHGLPEHLHAQHICHDFLRLAVHVGVDERHVVVARNAIPQR
eukprot:892696-Pelagomonas_calceolata.AAC.2